MFISTLTLRLDIENVMTKILTHAVSDKADSKPINVGKPSTKFAYYSIEISDLLDIIFEENEHF